MTLTNENKKFSSILAKYTLFISFLYSPFVFTNFINDNLRLALFGFLILILFLTLFSIKIKNIGLFKFLFFIFLFLVYLAGSLFSNKGDFGIRNAFGYSMILLFSALVYTLLLNSINFLKFIFKFYILIFYVVTISMILNFLFNLFFPSINIFNSLFSNNFGYDYNASPFGLSISKYIFGINFSRNFFFFVEPVYTAPFFLINIYLCQKIDKIRSKYFLFLNLIGGILSLSFLFFIGLSFLSIDSFRKSIKYPIFIIFLIAGIYIFTKIDDDNLLFASSSSSDRIDRIEVALTLLPEFETRKIIFGGGYLLTQNLEKSISSGFFSSLIEGGLVGLLIPFFFLLEYIKKNTSLFIICILSLLTLEIYKMPFFWLAIILGGLIINKKNEIFSNNT
jgi:hypothetical protein